MDHVEYKNNPRRRTIGYNAIFDEYINLSSNSFNDEIGFCESILTPYLEIFGYQSTKIQFQHQDIINQLSSHKHTYNMYLKYLSSGSGTESFPSDPLDSSTWE